MDYYKHVRQIEVKLAETLADENMLGRVSNTKYPYVLNILQDQSPEAQMELYSTSDGNTSSRDAAIRFIFHLDGLVIRTDSRVIVSDAFMNKIKNQAKKLHYAWLQAYFAEMTAGVVAEAPQDDAEADEAVDVGTENAEFDTEMDDFGTDGPSDDPFGDFYDEQEDECPEDTEGDE